MVHLNHPCRWEALQQEPYPGSGTQTQFEITRLKWKMLREGGHEEPKLRVAERMEHAVEFHPAVEVFLPSVR